MDAVDQRKLLKVVRGSSEISDIFEVPILSIPTLVILIASFGAFGATTYLYLNGDLHPLAVIVINSCLIYFSFTPLHEATHRSFSKVRMLNDALGTISAQLLLPGFSTGLYRYLHMAHHQHTGEKNSDPDLPFVSGSYMKKVLRWAFLDLLWTKFYFGNWKQRPVGERLRFTIGLVFYLSVFAVGFNSGYVSEFLVCWVFPMLLGRIITVYLFADIHHPENVEQRVDPLGATGMIRNTNLIQRILMLGQARHLIHHLYPGLPWYRYDPVWNVAEKIIPPSMIKWGTFFGLLK